MSGWMSPGLRLVAWVAVGLTVVGIACGTVLMFGNESSDLFWLGVALIAFNSYSLGKLAVMLWEDRR